MLSLSGKRTRRRMAASTFLILAQANQSGTSQGPLMIALLLRHQRHPRPHQFPHQQPCLMRESGMGGKGKGRWHADGRWRSTSMRALGRRTLQSAGWNINLVPGISPTPQARPCRKICTPETSRVFEGKSCRGKAIAAQVNSRQWRARRSPQVHSQLQFGRTQGAWSAHR